MKTNVTGAGKRPEAKEWVYTVRAELVPDSGVKLDISSNEAERASIAARLGILSVDDLTARIAVKKRNGGHVMEIKGQLEAQIVQECAKSLAPVASHVTDEFTAWFADYESAVSFNKARRDQSARLSDEDHPITDESEDPEPMENGQVNVADLVVQYLSLAIDPYVTKEDLSVSGDVLGTAHVPAEKDVSRHGTLRPNPFAALKNWRPAD